MKMNCRWRKGALRYSPARKIDDTRQIRGPSGWRKETDSVAETVYCDRRRASPGWRGGARVRK